eukprot:SAG25_NODE_409_length_8424_cov_3.527928_2_plen_1303_part_00
MGMLRTLFAVGVFSAVAQALQPTSRPVPLKLGGLFPKTGDSCVEGLGALFGARMAARAINVNDTAFGAGTRTNSRWKKFGGVVGERTPAGNNPFHLEVNLAESDTQGSKSEALWITDNYIHAGVNSLIGPLLSDVAESVALLAKYDKVPVVSYSAPMPKLTSATMGLNTFVRTFPSNKAVIKAAVDLVHHFEWEGVYLITTNSEEGVDTASEFTYWTSDAAASPGEATKTRIEHAQVVFVDNSVKSIRNKLQAIKDGSWRIIIVHAAGDMAVKIMHVAKAMKMVKMGWVWIGTQWASDSVFTHCVWPKGTNGNTMCENMTGFEVGQQFCSNNQGDACVDKLSDDGTAVYMTGDSDGDALIDMAGLVAIRVETKPSPTGSDLKDMWNSEKANFISEFQSLCPMIEQEPYVHRNAYYAFDAVLAAAKGAADLFDCGSITDRQDTDCGRLRYNWNNQALTMPRAYDIMHCPNGSTTLADKRLCSFISGSSAMFKSVEAIELAEGAAGRIGFVNRYIGHDGEESGGGDPSAIVLEVVNYRQDGDKGKFEKVGEWVQSRDASVCTHGHCGDLMPQDADGKWVPSPKIIWMGGVDNIPSDRVVDHHAGEAQYFLLVLIALILSLWGGSFLELMHFHYIPEAGLTCIIGMGVGGLIKLHVAITHSHHFEELAYFDEGIFALVLLPIIIFDAGFGAKKARFFGNIGPIMTCALFGTTISTFIVGIGMKLLGDAGWSDVEMGWFESFTFGALISAVDPVATLAVFGALKVETNLNYRVFGESIINDAVSIVLFRVFGKYMVEPWDGATSMLSAFGLFFKIGIGSTCMGVAVALFSSAVLKVSHIHDPLLACGVFILSSYCAYEITEALHLSGIIASLFAGFCMRNYALENIMEQYREMVLDMVHMLAAMSDLIIFFMVGENVILYMPYDRWLMIIWTIVLCLVGRFFNIFPLCAILNAFQSIDKKTIVLVKNDADAGAKFLLLEIDKQTQQIAFKGRTTDQGEAEGTMIEDVLITTIDEDPMTPNTQLSAILGYKVVSVGGTAFEESASNLAKVLADSGEESITVELEMDPRVDMKNQIVMFHSGLRGAIAFALALGFPSQHRKYIIDTTTWVILFTVFVMGGSTVPLLNALEIPLGCPDDPEELKIVDGALVRKKAREPDGTRGLLFKFLEFEAGLKNIITRQPVDELGPFALSWENLSEEQQQAALTLGYTNDDEESKVWPEYSYAWGSWLDLEEEKKQAAVVLGLHEFKWPPPDFSVMGTADSYVMSHKSGHDTEYDAAALVDEEGAAADESLTSNPVYSDEEDAARD